MGCRKFFFCKIIEAQWGEQKSNWTSGSNEGFDRGFGLEIANGDNKGEGLPARFEYAVEEGANTVSSVSDLCFVGHALLAPFKHALERVVGSFSNRLREFYFWALVF